MVERSIWLKIFKKRYPDLGDDEISDLVDVHLENKRKEKERKEQQEIEERKKLEPKFKPPSYRFVGLRMPIPLWEIVKDKGRRKKDSKPNISRAIYKAIVRCYVPKPHQREWIYRFNLWGVEG